MTIGPHVMTNECGPVTMWGAPLALVSFLIKASLLIRKRKEKKNTERVWKFSQKKNTDFLSQREKSLVNFTCTPPSHNSFTRPSGSRDFFFIFCETKDL